MVIRRKKPVDPDPRRPLEPHEIEQLRDISEGFERWRWAWTVGVRVVQFVVAGTALIVGVKAAIDVFGGGS